MIVVISLAVGHPPVIRRVVSLTAFSVCVLPDQSVHLVFTSSPVRVTALFLVFICLVILSQINTLLLAIIALLNLLNTSDQFLWVQRQLVHKNVTFKVTPSLVFRDNFAWSHPKCWILLETVFARLYSGWRWRDKYHEWNARRKIVSPMACHAYIRVPSCTVPPPRWRRWSN